MPAILLDGALVGQQKQKLGTSGGITPGTLRLFSNNLTVTRASVKADFTEVVGMSYAAWTIPSSSWSYSLDTSAHKVTASTTHTFTFSGSGGPLTIWGWYVLDGSDTIAMIGRKFDLALNIPTTGATLEIVINDIYKQTN